jgi:hypothetical protein
MSDRERVARTVRRPWHGEQLASALLAAGWDELVEVMVFAPPAEPS